MAKGGMLRRHHGSDTLEEGTFLDLGTMTFDGDDSMLGARSTVRSAEILRYEDLAGYSKLVYQGDVVILDYTSIANDQVAMRRMSLELKNIAKDVGGDVATIAKNLLCLTPSGVRIDRQRLRSQL